MVQIVFSDSACGSLKAAQKRGLACGECCSVGIISSDNADGTAASRRERAQAMREAQRRLREEWESFVPMGGNAHDIFGFSLMLSVGDISEAGIGDARESVLREQYSVFPDGGSDAARELFLSARRSLETVRARAADGEPLRIWYSDTPDELCGLYWLMEQLSDIALRDGQVSLVHQPSWELVAHADGGEHEIRRHIGWGETAPGEWMGYLSAEHTVSAAFCRGCALLWRELRRSSDPLRAVVSGHLIGVSEDFYDWAIMRELQNTDGIFIEAAVIGQVLGKYPFGITDCFIAHRIEHMLGAGLLEEMTPAGAGVPTYHRALRSVR